MKAEYTKTDWQADYLRAGDYHDRRLIALAEARDYESLGMLAEAKLARAEARELLRQYRAARALADNKFFGS